MALDTDAVLAINYSSNQSAGEGLRELAVDVADIGPALGVAQSASSTKALRLARGLLVTAPEIDTGAAELTSMVSWASEETAESRQVVVKAARLSAGSVLLVDRISALPADRAKPFMVDYFAAGGDRRAIAEWLQVVGHTLRQARAKPDGTAGGVIEWVGDRVEDAVDTIGEAVETVVDAVIEAGEAIADVIGEVVSWTVEQIGDFIEALLEAGRSIGEILASAITEGLSALGRFVEALVDLGRSVVEILDEALDAIGGAMVDVVRFLVRAGQAAVDVLAWAAGKVLGVLGDAVRGILAAGKSVVDFLVEVAQAAIGLLSDAIRGLLEIGRTLVGLLQDMLEVALDVLEAFLKAAFELGLTIAEFVGEVVKQTYKLAADVIKAALAAGVAIAELLGEVVAHGYFVIRKIINGIIEATGPIGEVLDWALSAVEDFVGDIWHATLTALRYAEAAISDALDWALEQGIEVFESVMRAWESVGESLLDAYRWAKEATLAGADLLFETIGEITVRIGNSVTYVLGYLEDDFLPGVAKFVKGLLDAGYAIADLVVRVVGRTVGVIAEAFRAALDVGVTLTVLLVETVKNPAAARENAMRAIRGIGQSLEDVFQAVNEAVEETLEDVVAALHAIGEAVRDILDAVVEVSLGLLGVVIAQLMNMLASFRPLTANERADARTVFGDSLDLDEVFVCQEDLTNEIIFGVQSLFEDDPRAFVTFNIINFDVDEGITRHTMIHELTHVWQAFATGPLYLSEAIHAQVPILGGEGYNYGYAEDASLITLPIDHVGNTDTFPIGSTIGLNGEAALNAAGGDFEAFNREQQGQIAMHFFVRTQLMSPPMDATAWEPYINVIRAA
jgi:phage-related protein